MIKFLIGAFIVIAMYAISWAICVGLMYLICLCFSWEFSLLIATGIWLILRFLKALFHSKK